MVSPLSPLVHVFCIIEDDAVVHFECVCVGGIQDVGAQLTKSLLSPRQAEKTGSKYDKTNG